MTESACGYRTPARLFHWIVALAVLLMIPAGLIMTREGLDRGLQDTLFIFHKNTGTLLIPLILARIVYRRLHPPPPLPDSVPGWQRRAAAVSHLTLYVLLVVMPLSGFVRVRAGGFPIELLDAMGAGRWLPKSEALAGAAQGLHFLAALLLIAVLAVHVSAALQHALLRRDGVWQRIWPPLGGG
ncbi:cytochrome b [Paracoccus sp. TOH]|uniref:cytochrome b n=1 Tax=Paracoccus sp. TOH TaxID=1263728 RepID=UPI0025B1707B|nr:cytochrome b [Paracoccus sp. TOH]WJS86635.1 cytochrome b [Paracoccus sp. TOH]